MDRRATRAWCFYDWANSAFATTVMAALFPPFFRELAIAAGRGEAEPYSSAKAACVWFNYRDNHSTPIPLAEREIIQQFEGIES